MSSNITVVDRLRKGVYATRRPDATILFSWPHQIAFKADPHVWTSLQTASTDGVDADNHTEIIEALRAGAWLNRTYSDHRGPLFEVRPLRPTEGSENPYPRRPDNGPARLSRFAIIRRIADTLVLESPLATADIVLHRADLLTAVLEPSTRPSTDRNITSGTGPTSAAASVPDSTADRLREEMKHHGFFEPAGGAEDTNLGYRQWSAHELWFHERSRLAYRGHVGDDFGGTWWGRSAGFAPLPARPDSYDGERIPLTRPDLNRITADDAPYGKVVEERASLRRHDHDHPITIDQLSELLYRTARVRRVHTDQDGVEFVTAPRPAGGSVYELEIYPLVTACEGLEPGFYHYDAHEHALTKVAEATEPGVRRMLRVATQASTEDDTAPQVVLMISARVGRVMWKYEQMGLTVILKNTGVLMGALAGACAAMNIAGCPLGNDDSAAFAEVTGRDRLIEPSVGQFIVGSKEQS